MSKSKSSTMKRFLLSIDPKRDQPALSPETIQRRHEGQTAYLAPSAGKVAEEQRDGQDGSRGKDGKKKKKKSTWRSGWKDGQTDNNTGATTTNSGDGDEILLIQGQSGDPTPLEDPRPTANEWNPTSDANESRISKTPPVLHLGNMKAMEHVTSIDKPLPVNPSHRKGLASKEVQSPTTTSTAINPDHQDEDPMVRIGCQLRAFRTESRIVKFGRELNVPCTLSDIELDLRTLIDEYRKCSRGLDDMDKYGEDLETRYKELQIKYGDELHEKTNRLSRMEREKDQKIDKLQGQIDAWNMFYNKEQIKTDATAAKQQSLISSLNGDKLNMDNLHGRVLEELNRLHSDALRKKDTDSKISQVAIINQFEMRIQQLQQSLDTKSTRHAGELGAMKCKLEEEQRRSGRQLEQEKLLAKQQISEAQKRMVQELRTAQDNFSAQLKEQEKLLTDTIQGRTSEIEKARGEFEIENVQTTRQFEAQRKEMERRWDAERRNLNTQIIEVQKQLREEIEGKSEAISNIKAELVVKHDKEKRAIKESNQKLKEALVARDHFKAMSDDELAYRFEEIGSEVGEFAQVVWDKRQESSWPFDEQSFQRSENKRRMKKYVLQNTIWVILYENIFCTPFRVFGKEGKGKEPNALEMEWVEEYDPAGFLRSPGILAPRATKASEKWRYETIQEYVEATEGGRKGDDNYDVKQGFEATLKKVTIEISHELERVAPLCESEQDRVGEVVTKAANLWLEVGQQRCRMFLVMSKSGEEPRRSARSSLNRDGTLSLVVMPELQRLGNAQGEQLDRVELVAGCQGQFSRFPL